MNRARKVTVVLSCLVGLIVLITVLSQFSWFPKSSSSIASTEQDKLIAEQDKSKASPIFQSGSIYLQGEKGKIGLLVPGDFGSPDGFKIKVKAPNKYMWHLWNQGEPLTGKKFRVEAVSVVSGEKQSVLLEGNTLVEEINWPGTVRLNGADAGFPTMMRFDNPGSWRLDAFIDERTVGSVTVEVK